MPVVYNEYAEKASKNRVDIKTFFTTEGACPSQLRHSPEKSQMP
jgi:hypothetical protein